MSLSLYSVCVPVLIRQLEALSVLLQKAEDQAKTRGFDPEVLVTARLAPDMFPLAKQVQIACDMAKGGASRLAGAEPPSHPDTETTLAQLRTRIATTVTLLQGLAPETFEGSPDRPMIIKLGGQDYPFTAQTYLLGFVLPNVFFHTSTAYAILRHNGIAIGKRDYLGGL
jgi:hypothetical protein